MLLDMMIDRISKLELEVNELKEGGAVRKSASRRAPPPQPQTPPPAPKGALGSFLGLAKQHKVEIKLSQKGNVNVGTLTNIKAEAVKSIAVSMGWNVGSRPTADEARAFLRERLGL